MHNHAFALFAAVTLAAVVAAVSLKPSVPIDLRDPDGFRSTCAALPRAPAQLRGDHERLAFAVCRDVALVARIATFLRQAKDANYGNAMPRAKVREVVRAELEHLRAELRVVRGALESIKGDPLLTLKPSSWQVDLDGDGKLAVWEAHFFALPRPGGKTGMRAPSDDAAYYAAEYRLDARILTDSSDVRWALSYHYFVESLVETVLAYTLDDNYNILLADASAMQRARGLLLQGLRTSEQMRRALLAERDDRSEGLANPRQRDTTFPVRLDEQDFVIWRQLIEHLIPLFEGKTLIARGDGASGLLGELARYCPHGSGVDLASFYNKPPVEPLREISYDKTPAFCRMVDDAHPASALPAFLSEYEARADGDHSAGMDLLKQLLWVN